MKNKKQFKRMDFFSFLAWGSVLAIVIFEAVFVFELYRVRYMQVEPYLPLSLQPAAEEWIGRMDLPAKAVENPDSKKPAADFSAAAEDSTAAESAEKSPDPAVGPDAESTEKAVTPVQEDDTLRNNADTVSAGEALPDAENESGIQPAETEKKTVESSVVITERAPPSEEELKEVLSVKERIEKKKTNKKPSPDKKDKGDPAPAE